MPMAQARHREATWQEVFFEGSRELQFAGSVGAGNRLHEATFKAVPIAHRLRKKELQHERLRPCN